MKALRKSLIVILAVLVLTTTLLSFTPTTSSADNSLKTADPEEPVLSADSIDPAVDSGEDEWLNEGQYAEATVSVGPEIPGDTGKASFAYDCASESFQYMKGNLHDKLYPASITKLFTAYVALQYLDLSTQVKVGKIIDTLPADSSVALLSVGDLLTVKDLLYGMMLPSGGDAARVMAVTCGRALTGDPKMPEADAMDCFVNEMNRQAQQCGMTDSHFVNPDGYHDDDHYMSLADVVCLGKLCLKNPVIMKAAKTTVYNATRLNVGKKLQWINTNWMLHKYRHPQHYRENVIGLKTGFTGQAGNCMLSVFELDGRYILIGAFGCKTRSERFQSCLEIYDALYD